MITGSGVRSGEKKSAGKSGKMFSGWSFQGHPPVIRLFYLPMLRGAAGAQNFEPLQKSRE
jgi:hypothetical protein